MSVADLPPTIASALVAPQTAGWKQRGQPAAAPRRPRRLGSARHIDLPDLEVTRPTLEDIYLELTEAGHDRSAPAIERSRSWFVPLVLHQFRADLRCFLRNKQSVFFTLALPVLFLAIFASVFKHQNVAVPGGRINEPVYYVPGIIAYGLIAATFSNLVVSVVRYREAGIYKRRRATPVSASAVIAGRALVAALTALVLTAVLLAIGWAAFGAHIPGRTGPAFLLDIIVGAVVFCCLGFAVASVVKKADAAQPVVLAIILPLCFISGVFIPILELPHWLSMSARSSPCTLLPMPSLVPTTRTHVGSGLDWVDLAVLVGWGVAGLVFAFVASTGCLEAHKPLRIAIVFGVEGDLPRNDPRCAGRHGLAEA